LSKYADACFSATVVNHLAQLTTTDIHVGIDWGGTSFFKKITVFKAFIFVLSTSRFNHFISLNFPYLGSNKGFSPEERRGKTTRDVNVIVHLHLISKLEMRGLCLHIFTRLHSSLQN